MRLLISTLAATTLFCALVLLLGCNTNSAKNMNTINQSAPLAASSSSPPPPTTPAGDGAARISVADLRAALDKGTAVIIDVRSDDQYKAGHIKGAAHIPEMSIAARSGELPRDKTIVTYCS